MNLITFTPGESSRYYKDRLPHLKQTGAQWSCGCPRHGGKDPNFKVEAATGRWYCHSVCGCGGDIIDLEMALTAADFKTAKAEVFRIVGRIEPRRTTGGWREIERYPYTDQVGTLLFESIRYLKPDGKKTFVQVRPSGVEAAGTTDPERVGGVPTGGIVVGLVKGKYLPDPKAQRATGKLTWRHVEDQIDYDGAEYRFRDCPRVPYRLPKVLSAETVYLPEGEKDVHTLESWGLVASCNPGGSGESHLYTGWAEHFRNRHVIILPDNDGPGRKHALAVATALLTAAASIRVVELPGLPDKGDVTDWRNAGGTLEQFRVVTGAPIEECNPMEATADINAGFLVPRSRELLDQAKGLEAKAVALERQEVLFDGSISRPTLASLFDDEHFTNPEIVAPAVHTVETWVTTVEARIRRDRPDLAAREGQRSYRITWSNGQLQLGQCSVSFPGVNYATGDPTFTVGVAA